MKYHLEYVYKVTKEITYKIRVVIQNKYGRTISGMQKHTAYTASGIPIEVRNDERSIVIITYILPLPLEFVLYLTPVGLFVLFWLELQDIFHIPINKFYWVTLILIFFIFTTCIFLGKDAMFSLVMEPIRYLHRKFGRKHILIFSRNTRETGYSGPRNQTFLSSNIMAVGYHGYIRAGVSPIDNNAFLMTRIVLILENTLVLPIGGAYGCFFTASPSQKREFEQLYSFLAHIFGFGIMKYPERFKESQHYTQRMAYFEYNGIKVVTKKTRYSTIRSCSYQNQYLDMDRVLRFKSKFDEFLHFGLYEITLTYQIFLLMCISVIFHSSDIIYTIVPIRILQVLTPTSILIEIFQYAVLVRTIYILWWWWLWKMIKGATYSHGTPNYFFQFTNIPENIAENNA